MSMLLRRKYRSLLPSRQLHLDARVGDLPQLYAVVDEELHVTRGKTMLHQCVLRWLHLDRLVVTAMFGEVTVHRGIAVNAVHRRDTYVASIRGQFRQRSRP